MPLNIWYFIVVKLSGISPVLFLEQVFSKKIILYITSATVIHPPCKIDIDEIQYESPTLGKSN